MIVKAVGLGLLPDQVPLKPMLVEAPVARAPFQSRFLAVTAWPLCAQVALQPCESFWVVVGKVNPSVQAVSGSPRFLTDTLAVNPPCQSLLV